MTIVRLGEARDVEEGLRIGTVRRPPRGVPKKEYAAKNIYDVWFPNLSPSEPLLKETFPLEDEKDLAPFSTEVSRRDEGTGSEARSRSARCPLAPDQFRRWLLL